MVDVYTVLAPYLTVYAPSFCAASNTKSVFQPILQQVTGVLHEGSKAVISSEDQFEVTCNHLAVLDDAYKISRFSIIPVPRTPPTVCSPR